MTDSYIDIHSYRYQKLFESIEKLNLPIDSKILDIGCYPTYLSDWLKEQKFDVYGISSEHEKIKDPKVSILNIETENFPFEKNFFDLVICTEVIEHISYSPSNLLKKINHILKPNGHFILTTPNVSRLQNVLSLLFDKNIYFPLYQMDQDIYFRHQREYTKQEICDIHHKSGFKNINIAYYTAYPPFRAKNKRENIILQIIKWLNYIVAIFIPRFRDSIFAISKKK
jgi:2-polyprenyl-3-methyl-5-hydroxy-6-metoxy-1,4-benzoquinol methylase